MNIATLIFLNKSRIINLSKLCRHAGLNYNSIISKISRNIELKVNEAEALKNSLRELKIEIIQ